MKQLSMELSTLLQQAQYNESKINAPRSNLEQLYTESRHNKEGYSDCEVDDMASCCNRDTNLQLMCKQSTWSPWLVKFAGNDMKMGNLTCFSVTDMRYKTLGAEVGTNDQDIRLQDHKNMEVCGTSMKPGVTSRMQKNLCVISVMWNLCVISCGLFLHQCIVNSHRSNVSVHETKGVCGGASYLPSQAPSTNDPASTNHVINEIKLKGCDWPTAYGFCQGII
ncbi:hypothetical protein OPV22_015279 [Ensete ventricosum]|uniref:Uncharacterized protein n=1 Tax=Ensete ventricosum TaxID=4639 RepID=A0AAV8RBJ0_ENSVE|nr:hypothetical protein OPV22_015279 [Ensete ventricosum]